MNDIEQSVTKLLLATKQLLDGLTQWSNGRINDQQVYDIFHSLTAQFAQAKRAFESADISMADLMYVPDDLRHCLIIALDEQPSSNALEHHLPTIRDVIIRLLQGLKRKQAQFRDRSEGDSATLSQRSSRSSSRNSTRSSQPPPRSSDRPETVRKSSSDQIYGTSSPRASDSRPLSPHSNRSDSPTPSTSTSGDRLVRQQSGHLQRPSSPTPPRSFNPLPVPQMEYSGDFDMNDPKTADALAALNKQENLARRSSVRRASALYRTTSTASRSPGRLRYGSDPKTRVPPVPTLPDQLSPELPLANAFDDSERQQDQSTQDFLDQTKESSDRQRSDSTSTVHDKDGASSRTMDLYLKLGKKVKKVEYNGPVELSSLRMLFVEKFQYIARNDQFPAIYICSPSTHISYELDNMADVKHESLLTLETEELEPTSLGQQITEKINIGFISMTKEMSEVRQELLAYLKDTYEKAAVRDKVVETVPAKAESAAETKSAPEEKGIKAESVTPAAKEEPVSSTKTNPSMDLALLKEVKSKLSQVESIRRDMGVVRQLHDGFRAEMQGLMSGLREKSSQLKVQPVNLSGARKFVDEGKNELDTTAEDITKRLEDLQDTIDELKLDVTARKCRPSSTQMQHCDQEAKKLQVDISKLADKLQTVKPMWKKTWEEELQNIVKEQQFLKEQEALLEDLQEDHAAILEVFEQLQKIREIQEKSKSGPKRQFRIVPTDNGHEGMSSVLKQVSTIDVDPERRLRALNQAEKMRERELANRIDEFEQELTNFVGTKRLRMTGGAQEIERQRQKKNQNMLRQIYEKKKGSDAENAQSSQDGQTSGTDSDAQVNPDENAEEILDEDGPIQNEEEIKEDGDSEIQNQVAGHEESSTASLEKAEEELAAPLTNSDDLPSEPQADTTTHSTTADVIGLEKSLGEVENDAIESESGEQVVKDVEQDIDGESEKPKVSDGDIGE
ncbi:Bud site selection protein 6 [Umbelopsis sp. WA50703]